MQGAELYTFSVLRVQNERLGSSLCVNIAWQAMLLGHSHCPAEFTNGCIQQRKGASWRKAPVRVLVANT